MANALNTTSTHSQIEPRTGLHPVLKTGALVVSAGVLMALCAHVSLPLLFTPVPLTLQTFGVIVIALTLGSRRAAVAMALYLLEGAAGLPVFSPAGLGGIAQLLGPTGGYLMAYPLAAFLAGYIFEQRGKNSTAALAGAIAAELVLFTSGTAWLMAVTATTFSKAMMLAALPYIPGEVLKVAAAMALATRWHRRKSF